MKPLTNDVFFSNQEAQVITLNAKNPVKQNLEEFGFKTAGKSDGSVDAFLQGLNLIRNGNIIEAGNDLEKRKKKEKEITDQVDQIEKDRAAMQQEIKKVNQILIPNLRKKIVDLMEEIRSIKLNMTERKVASGFNKEKFTSYLILTVALSIYLFIFYSSVLYGAFFNDTLSVLESSDSPDLSLMLNSIFSPDALINPGKVGIFTYGGTFFIFALGFLPHIFLHSENVWKKYGGALFSFSLPLLLDALLAYKIDASMEQVKALIGMESDPKFWLHPNFWLVILFGYLAYLVWGIIVEAAFTEWGKRDHLAVGRAKIKLLKEKINDQETEILDHKLNICEMEKVIQLKELDKVALQKQLDSTTYSVTEMLVSLDSYVRGFYNYLNYLFGTDLKLLECKNIYKGFKYENFKINQSINLN